MEKFFLVDIHSSTLKMKFNKAQGEGQKIHVKILFLHRFILYLIMNLSVVKWKGKGEQ